MKQLALAAAIVLSLGYSLTTLQARQYSRSEPISSLAWTQLLMETSERQAVREEQLRKAQLEYEAEKQNHDMFKLITEINTHTIALSEMVQAREKLRRDGAVDALLEVSIRKFTQEIKEKTDRLWKLTKR